MKKLTIDDIKVPEGMVEAACGFSGNPSFIRSLLAKALLWLAENPIVPTPEDHTEMWGAWMDDKNKMENYSATFAREWQRRMFLKPEPEVPQEILDYCAKNANEPWGDLPKKEQRHILAIFELGKKAVTA